ncbi:hypothetical protein BDZ85DRAFT_97237 [Elsinoe ampelina]|uniref:Uncharacterized protein n=1 Tax=Elsinoe ampelina TaxID=302913 RepID=A0A6A6GEZ2_9PEZI|nr:hypothetical protein BDZ85DRAFT_97237 [Elsinoe ampelina]
MPRTWKAHVWPALTTSVNARECLATLRSGSATRRSVAYRLTNSRLSHHSLPTRRRGGDILFEDQSISTRSSSTVRCGFKRIPRALLHTSDECPTPLHNILSAHADCTVAAGCSARRTSTIFLGVVSHVLMRGAILIIASSNLIFSLQSIEGHEDPQATPGHRKVIARWFEARVRRSEPRTGARAVSNC